MLISGNDGEALLQDLLAPFSAKAGARALRLHLSSAAEAAQPAGADGRTGGGSGSSAQCGAGGGGGAGGGPKLQQVELLMSTQAQHWLFHRLAAANRDPSAALQMVLAQLQAHFVEQQQQQAAAAVAAASADLGPA